MRPQISCVSMPHTPSGICTKNLHPLLVFLLPNSSLRDEGFLGYSCLGVIRVKTFLLTMLFSILVPKLLPWHVLALYFVHFLIYLKIRSDNKTASDRSKTSNKCLFQSEVHQELQILFKPFHHRVFDI